ncbi:GNAT family N-acetyltransferase [Streptomyces sp. NPDC054887]
MPPRPPALNLTRLRDDHAPALLAFERENRAYFARSVPDRGDDYFTRFAARHAALLAEQDAGACHFHLLLDDDGAVLGRVNLVDVENGSADLGYRVAERVAGRGLAVAAVREIRSRAANEYGLTALTAATTLGNAASRAVLARTGFVPVGDIDLGGQPGTRYRLRLDQWIG